MAEILTIKIDASDIGEVRLLCESVMRIANMPRTDDGFNPRTMQRIAREALEEFSASIGVLGD